jgi:hypothetical protein
VAGAPSRPRYDISYPISTKSLISNLKGKRRYPNIPPLHQYPVRHQSFYLRYPYIPIFSYDIVLKESTIYVPPTTPMLKSRVRFLPQSGRSRSTISDDSRRFPMLNLRYQELGQCAIWIKGSTSTAFYPRILPNCHGYRIKTSISYQYRVYKDPRIWISYPISTVFL